MIEDAATLTNLTRGDARRRVRIAVAVYGMCLVALLLAGSYLAPATAIDAPNGVVAVDGASTNLQVR